MLKRYSVIIPAYNEAKRLHWESVRELLAHPRVHIKFVNDGSSDATPALLNQCARESSRVTVMHLPVNSGKAEATRQGMLAALNEGAVVVGFLDADLSTSPTEMLRLIEILNQERLDVVLGSRIRMLGTAIERSSLRHILGRLFASLVSSILSMRVYDTQCGAKVFRSTPSLEASLRDPFQSRWAFDVELIGRLFLGVHGTPRVPLIQWKEIPLTAWEDKKASKIRPLDYVRVLFDLLRIGRTMKQLKAEAVANPLTLMPERQRKMVSERAKEPISRRRA